MPSLYPVSRRELIRRFRRLGFEGPNPGGKHEFMIKGPVGVPIPNPHRGDIGVPLLRIILREAGISVKEWESVA